MCGIKPQWVTDFNDLGGQLNQQKTERSLQKKDMAIKQTKWAIDQSHSEISFKVKNLMIAHICGTFSTFDANIYTTEKDFKTAEIDVWIDAGSIKTGDEKRDEHLKGPEFFDVEKHKQITFTASTIGASNTDGESDLWGTITIKGIKKKVKMKVEFGGIVRDPWGIEKAGFTITGKINRADFGVSWNKHLHAGGLMICEQIKISCEIVLINTSPSALTMELIPDEKAINEN